MITYNVRLPFTGNGSTILDFLPASTLVYNVYSNKNFSIGEGNRANCASQHYSAVIGGVNNRIVQSTAFPWNPTSIRNGIGSGSGIGVTVLGGANNIAYGDYSLVAGGTLNQAYQAAGTILGGVGNIVGGEYNAIINGNYNRIQTGTRYSFVIGGNNNTVQSNVVNSSIIGSQQSTVFPRSSSSLIIGGWNQSIGLSKTFGPGADACYSYLFGGYQNRVYSGNCYSTIIGGAGNSIDAAGSTFNRNVPATGWSHIVVSNGTTIRSNYSFALGADYGFINNNASKSFIIGANGSINAESSYIIGGTATTILAGHENSAIISQRENSRNIGSRGPRTLLINFDSGVFINNRLQLDGPLILNYNNPPTSPHSSGVRGQIAYDADNFYICLSENEWRRMPLSEWGGEAPVPGAFKYYATSYVGQAVKYAEDVVAQSKYELADAGISSTPPAYATEGLHVQNNSGIFVRPLFDKYQNSTSLDLNNLKFEISPPLLGNLKINPSNGVITGVVSQIFQPENIVHTITATGPGGTTSSKLRINYGAIFDNETANILESNNAWLQGCGCGCAGGIGAGGTVLYYKVFSARAKNTLGDIDILVSNVPPDARARFISFAYPFGPGGSASSYQYTLTNSHANTSWTESKYTVRIPYENYNFYIRIELYRGAAGSSTIIFRYNPVTDTSDF